MRLILFLTLCLCFPVSAQTKMDPALAEAITAKGCIVSDQQELVTIVASVGLERTFGREAFFELFFVGELLPIGMVHPAYARPEGYFEIISKYVAEGERDLLVVSPSICTRSAVTSSPAYNALFIDGLLENAKLYRPSDEAVDPRSFPLLRAVIEALDENGCQLSIEVPWEPGFVKTETDLTILASIAQKAGVDVSSHPDIAKLLETSLRSDEVGALDDHRRPIISSENSRSSGHLARVITLLDCNS